MEKQQSNEITADVIPAVPPPASCSDPVVATWSIELNCECPKCYEYVDLLDYADFWDWHHQHLEIAERKQGMEVMCPDCGHEFEVNCEY